MQAFLSIKIMKLRENHSRPALSVFNDIYFRITEKHTPKHVALAETIHHMTWSKFLIIILNKLGHCSSYKALKKLDEVVPMPNVSKDLDKKLHISKNIVTDTSLFLHGAIDHNNFNEETLNVKESTHVTAMVIYQEKKNADLEINIIKRKPIVKPNRLNSKSHNFQEIFYFESTL